MKKIKVYSRRVFTSPGRSYWSERFSPFSAYIQEQMVFEKEVEVEDYFAELVEESKTIRNEQYLMEVLRSQGKLD